jgi:hypothetical protein
MERMRRRYMPRFMKRIDVEKEKPTDGRPWASG